MLHRRLVFSIYFSFVTILLAQVCSRAQKVHLCENPSSCGNLVNISYPFRLKDDPPNCGDINYELSCEKNRPILSLFSGKYYVTEINYENSIIRVVDIGIQLGNCSSLPFNSLTYSNFSWRNPPGHSYYLNKDDVAMFLSCETRVESTRYIDATSCIDRKGYIYALVGEILASEIRDLCTIDQILPIDLTTLPTDHRNLSIQDVHDSLAFGFELYWSVIYCAYCRKQGHCIFDRATSIVKCSLPCSLYHVSSFDCAMQLTLAFSLGLSTLAGIFIGFCTAAKCAFGGPLVFIFLIHKWRTRHLSMFNSVEEFLQKNNNLMPIRYSYSQLKKMTSDFKYKLGEGGFGSVYKGKLRSGALVAVKILCNKSKSNGQEFFNEVATIGRIHHVNIVKLIGYCVEGSKRALVYEFMPNGSLDKYILSSEREISLSWEKIYKISLGVARGIEYLHCGCDMQILHFDIKPHNILLDESFNPKISDFGLAKLYPCNNVVVTLTAVRGTMGYIAPELLYKNIGGVSYKADVYSFGMLLMEMAGKRNKSQSIGDSSGCFFPFTLFDQLVAGKEIEIGDGTLEEKKIVKRMVMVALWCIQINPTNRPSMNKVVKMLEESESIPIPPRIFMYPEEFSAMDSEDSR